jgi:hypothetical protein
MTMTESALREHVHELREALQQLSRPSADGPCWCARRTDDQDGGGSHSRQCGRARALLTVGDTLGSVLADAAPGYGFGV